MNYEKIKGLGNYPEGLCELRIGFDKENPRSIMMDFLGDNCNFWFEINKYGIETLIKRLESYRIKIIDGEQKWK